MSLSTALDKKQQQQQQQQVGSKISKPEKLFVELSCVDGDICDDNSVDLEEQQRLADLYQAAKDENELLEFKNYELLFKIQELEQKQKSILSKLEQASDDEDNNECAFGIDLLPDDDDNVVELNHLLVRGSKRPSSSIKAATNEASKKHDYDHYDHNHYVGQVSEHTRTESGKKCCSK